MANGAEEIDQEMLSSSKKHAGLSNFAGSSITSLSGAARSTAKEAQAI